MRGQQLLFEQLIDKDTQLTVSRQGRSQQLHDLRNECLIDRYFFYLKFTDKRYDAILEKLKQEFFLEAFTIQERITEGYEFLAKLKQEPPQKNYFVKKWPHLVW